MLIGVGLYLIRPHIFGKFFTLWLISRIEVVISSVKKPQVSAVREGKHNA